MIVGQLSCVAEAGIHVWDRVRKQVFVDAERAHRGGDIRSIPIWPWDLKEARSLATFSQARLGCSPIARWGGRRADGGAVPGHPGRPDA
jgi:hypothetical protein